MKKIKVANFQTERVFQVLNKESAVFQAKWKKINAVWNNKYAISLINDIIEMCFKAYKSSKLNAVFLIKCNLVFLCYAK